MQNSSPPAAQADLFNPDPLPPLPKGWRADVYQGFEQMQFTRAVDPDGLRWYPIDGYWRLHVPYFRGDDLAICDTERGNQPYPITDDNTILIGSRKIGERDWHH